MKTIRFKDTAGNLLLAFSLLFGIGIMSSLTTQARPLHDSYGQDDRRNRDYQRDRERRRR